MEQKFNHYFITDKTRDYKKHNFEFIFNGHKYFFVTEDGVFSKNQIDDGSLFLVKTVINENLVGDGLDLGCGYGAITVLLASNCKVNMVACDINERAVDLANENFKLNNIDACAVISNVADEIENNNFDFVISNPPIRVGNSILFKFFMDSYEKLMLGGSFYAVLRKKQGAETYMKKLKEIYSNCKILDKYKGYVVVKCIKNKIGEI